MEDMRTSYEKPEMEVTIVNAEENDIVTLSNGGPNGEWNEDLDDLFN